MLIHPSCVYARAQKVTSARLVDIDMTGANLKGANLKDADLEGSILCGVTMPDGSRYPQGCK